MPIKRSSFYNTVRPRLRLLQYYAVVFEFRYIAHCIDTCVQMFTNVTGMYQPKAVHDIVTMYTMYLFQSAFVSLSNIKIPTVFYMYVAGNCLNVFPAFIGVFLYWKPIFKIPFTLNDQIYWKKGKKLKSFWLIIEKQKFIPTIYTSFIIIWNSRAIEQKKKKTPCMIMINFRKVLFDE